MPNKELPLSNLSRVWQVIVYLIKYWHIVFVC